MAHQRLPPAPAPLLFDPASLVCILVVFAVRLLKRTLEKVSEIKVVRDGSTSISCAITSCNFTEVLIIIIIIIIRAFVRLLLCNNGCIELLELCDSVAIHLLLPYWSIGYMIMICTYLTA